MSANPNLGADRIKAFVGSTLWLEQLKAGAIVLVWSVGATLILAKIVSVVCDGLRVSEEVETIGLDLTEHGEEGYHG